MIQCLDLRHPARSTLVAVLASFVLALPLSLARPADTPTPKLFERGNLVAWCIVPFDAKKRSPEERAAMLKRLGFKHYAYDWRAEHLPTFDREIAATPNRKLDLAPTLGLATRRQRRPSQCAMRVWWTRPLPSSPTAHAAEPEVAVTALKDPYFAELPLFGLGTVVHLLPFQWAISVFGPFPGL